ncbi:MAG: peroxiredoxin family protein [Gammaproteobacteria bacterium]|nr:peroxiredoxin family protein [Gammaproteobacteria bacterium]
MRFSLLLVFLLALTGCQDDLLPSGEDKRPSVIAGSIGHLPTQKIADFTLPSTQGGNLSLSQLVNLDGNNATPADAVVIYFTMWCSTCTDHANSMVSEVEPTFNGSKNIRYLIVDYVSGSLNTASQQLTAPEYSFFDILVDANNSVQNQLHGGMGITVIIDSQGIIHMNQDYNVVKVVDVLAGI